MPWSPAGNMDRTSRAILLGMATAGAGGLTAIVVSLWNEPLGIQSGRSAERAALVFVAGMWAIKLLVQLVLWLMLIVAGAAAGFSASRADSRAISICAGLVPAICLGGASAALYAFDANLHSLLGPNLSTIAIVAIAGIVAGALVGDKPLSEPANDIS